MIFPVRAGVELRLIGGTACAIAVSLLLTGCNGSETAGATSRGAETPSQSVTRPTPQISTTSASAADIARRDATAAYLGMWQDMAQAAATSDWHSVGLAHHATGDALSTISRGLYADNLNGLVTRGEPKNSPKVSLAAPETNPATVMISDCGDSAHWLKYRKDNGKPADDAPGGRQAITAEVKKLSDGTWKVTRFAVEAVGSC